MELNRDEATNYGSKRFYSDGALKTSQQDYIEEAFSIARATSAIYPTKRHLIALIEQIRKIECREAELRFEHELTKAKLVESEERRINAEKIIDYTLLEIAQLKGGLIK